MNWIEFKISSKKNTISWGTQIKRFCSSSFSRFKIKSMLICLSQRMCSKLRRWVDRKKLLCILRVKFKVHLSNCRGEEAPMCRKNPEGLGKKKQMSSLKTCWMYLMSSNFKAHYQDWCGILQKKTGVKTFSMLSWTISWMRHPWTFLWRLQLNSGKSTGTTTSNNMSVILNVMQSKLRMKSNAWSDRLKAVLMILCTL